MQKIDRERCLRALENIYIEGAPEGAERLKAIEDAIGAIQVDGETALQKEYIGVKNYAHFGDQRSDHEYNMGPRHGHIVFRIARKRGIHGSVARLGADEIYLLECVRDAGTFVVKNYWPRDNFSSEKLSLNLAELLIRWKQAELLTKELSGLMAEKLVHSSL